MTDQALVIAEATTLTPGGPILADPAALAKSLETYTASRAVLLAWLDQNLTPGVDYQLIHRKTGYGQNKRDCENKADKTSKTCPKCGGKATLCKPGSEKLCGLLRLRPVFKSDTDTWEMLGRPEGDNTTVCLVCELVAESGEVIAEGRGCRRLATDYGDVNKTIKMVQKSAQTDAVLRVGGLSEVFTQDLEDATPTMPEVSLMPRRKSEAATDTPPASVVADPPAPEPGSQEEDTIGAAVFGESPRLSDPERRALVKKLKAGNIDMEAFKTWLGVAFGVQESREIRKAHLPRILAWVAEQVQTGGGDHAA